MPNHTAETFWRVELPYATFALVTIDGWVTEAPPIAKWTEGKLIDVVQAWAKQKHGTCIQLQRA